MKKIFALILILVILTASASAVTPQEYAEAYNAVVSQNAVKAELNELYLSDDTWFITDPYDDVFIALILKDKQTAGSVIVRMNAGGSVGKFIAMCSWAFEAAYPGMDPDTRDAIVARTVAWSYDLFGEKAYYPVAYKENTEIGEIVYQETTKNITVLFPLPQ